MSKANSNFDHLIKDKHGDKEVKGTYFTIHELEERVVELEKLSHEPQNYRKKCEEMEERIDKLEAFWQSTDTFLRYCPRDDRRV